MLMVECYSGYKVNERPVAFNLFNRRLKVKEIIDRWYGEMSVHFKVRADDDNIYLLKYDEWQDQWDLVFYQNPRKMEPFSASWGGLTPRSPRALGWGRAKPLIPLH